MFYLDMDGVIADFVRGVIKFHNIDLAIDDVRWNIDKQAGMEGDEFWGPLGKEFWENLDICQDGISFYERLVDEFGANDVLILSSPIDTDGCCDGKRSWIRRHLPEMDRRVFFGNNKSLLAHPGALLIDDHLMNCEAFVAEGNDGMTTGNAFLIPRPWNAKSAKCENGSFDVSETWREFKDYYWEVTYGGLTGQVG